MKTDGGIRLLARPEREAAENLFAKLREYGLFVVPDGELECWLPELRVPRGQKIDWLIKTLEAMGEEPTDIQYVRPAVDGVWKFLDTLNDWLVNPSRRGIPD
jgi:hypothetical protein